MTKYLLTCECGKNVAVDVGQAGGTVVCQCGKQLDVPPLRKLRHLPIAEPDPASAAAATPWNARKGVIAVFLLVAAVAALSAFIIRVNEATVPPFDHEVQMFNVDRSLEAMTPEQAFQMWTYYRAMSERGLAEFSHRDKADIEKTSAEQRFTQKMLWTLAAICAGIACLAALWPRPKPIPSRPR